MQSPFMKNQFIALAVSVFMLGNASAFFEDAEARRAILDIRQKLDSHKADADKSAADVGARITTESQRQADEVTQLRRSLLTMQNQIDGLRDEVAKLRGQNEQLARDVSESQRLHRDFVQTVQARLQQLEPLQITHDGVDFTVEQGEKRDFEAAFATFRNGDFAQAQTAFGDFINRYPRSGYRVSALFWLGNAQYAEKDYRQAIHNFRQILTLAPNHLRAPEAMLSIANSQLEMKDNRGARKTLLDLVAAHPKSEAASAARDKLSRLK
jgi:tol-pal system protein YbgF